MQVYVRLGISLLYKVTIFRFSFPFRNNHLRSVIGRVEQDGRCSRVSSQATNWKFVGRDP